MSGPDPKYSDLELCDMALRTQRLNPHLSEGAVMGVHHMGREYLADRAKKSQSVQECRSLMSAIRERYYLELGLDGCKMGKDFNSITFIWITRNVLGWRDNRTDDSDGLRVVQSPITITPEGLLTLVKTARGDDDAA